MKHTLRTALLAVVLLPVGCGETVAPSGSPALGEVSPPAPTIDASPGEAQLPYAWPATLAAGTYTTGFVWETPVTFEFTIPDGWVGRDVEVFTDPVSRLNEVGGPRGRSIMFALVDNVYADPCRGILRDPPVGESVDDLAAALASLPGVTATAPASVEFAGHPARYVEFSIPADAGCDLGSFHLWSTRRDWMKPEAHSGGIVFTAERQDYRTWILNVGGVRYLIAAMSADDATSGDLEELQEVLDSIKLST